MKLQDVEHLSYWVANVLAPIQVLTRKRKHHYGPSNFIHLTQLLHCKAVARLQNLKSNIQIYARWDHMTRVVFNDIGTYIDLLRILRNTIFNYKWIAYSCGAFSFTYSLVQLINENLAFCLYINAYGKLWGNPQQII